MLNNPNNHNNQNLLLLSGPYRQYKETKMPTIDRFKFLMDVMSLAWTHLHTSACSIFTYGRFFRIQQLDLSIG